METYMKILIISDNHGASDAVRLSVRKEHPDKILHLGDSEGDRYDLEQIVENIPFEMVKGNCDSYFYGHPDNLTITIGSHVIFMTHGHAYNVKYSLSELRAIASSSGAEYALYGHTHVPDVDYNGGITCINPGSIAYPRQIGRKATYAIMNLDDQDNLTFEIKEL